MSKVKVDSITSKTVLLSSAGV